MTASSSGPHTRPSLLLRLRDAQDQEAWETFVQDYGPLVYHYCRRKGLQHADAEEVAQEVFTQVKRSIGNFEYQPTIGRYRDYFRTIVRHKTKRFLDKEARQPHGRGGAEDDPALDGVADPEEDPDWKDEIARHRFALAQARSRPHFHPDTWRAFELVILANRSAAEVAEELGKTPGWVYVAKSRVCKRILEESQTLMEDGIL